MNIDDKRRGLYGKYHIEKADGSPMDPEAKYIVLRYDCYHSLEQIALLRYAEAIKEEYPKFGEELYEEVLGEIKKRHALNQ